MVFLKSFKLVFLFILSCFFINLNIFATKLALDELPFYDDQSIQNSNAKKLRQWLTKSIDFKTGELRHEGIFTLPGLKLLEDYLNSPARLQKELEIRQDIIRKFVELNQSEFNEIRQAFEKLTKNFYVYGLNVQIKKLEEQLKDIREHEDEKGFFGIPKKYSANSNMAMTIGMTIYWIYYLRALAYGVYASPNMGFAAGSIGASLATGWLFRRISGGMPIRSWVMYESLFGSMIPGVMAAKNYLSSWLPWNSSMVLGASCIEGFNFCKEQVKKDGFAVRKWAGHIAHWMNGLPKRISDPVSYQLEELNTQFDKEVETFGHMLNSFLATVKNVNPGLIALIVLKSKGAKPGFEYEQTAMSYIDVFLGLASLFRESNEMVSDAPNLKRYPISFVKLVQPAQTGSLFEMHIDESLKLFDIDSSSALHVSESYYNKKDDNTIQAPLDLTVNYKDGSNEFFVNSKPMTQNDFLKCIMPNKGNVPVMAQMLLANTFGIVFGKSATMTFYDFNNAKFRNFCAFLMPPVK